MDSSEDKGIGSELMTFCDVLSTKFWLPKPQKIRLRLFSVLICCLNLALCLLQLGCKQVARGLMSDAGMCIHIVKDFSHPPTNLCHLNLVGLCIRKLALMLCVPGRKGIISRPYRILGPKLSVTPLGCQFSSALVLKHAPCGLICSFLGSVRARRPAGIVAFIFPFSVQPSVDGSISAFTHRIFHW